MSIVERALQMISNDMTIGLGSGRAARAFVVGLGERVRNGGVRVRGVSTSQETASVASAHGIPLVSLAEAEVIDITFDGADEVDPQLNLIKGYGRALVREKIVAASSRRLVILIGEEKRVPRLGSRGKLPIEVLPFAIPLCRRRLKELGMEPNLWQNNGEVLKTDNGSCIFDCQLGPIEDPASLEQNIRQIPGVVGTGLFLGMAHTVLVGSHDGMEFVNRLDRS